MDVGVVVSPSADGVRELARWLGEEDELRGRVRLREGEAVSGTLGAITDGLVAVLGPAGVGAFAAGVVQWLRTRRTDVEVEVSRADGATMKVSAKYVQGLTAAAVRDLVDDLATFARSGDE
ncbi:effector-associated constant component EACC1 [Phytohabitans houttuyneae]|uniref:Uncharacterized protein n=1 Tax=Phytohabitans houttuyneae TaxID=1076126 RepID=A0A6V8KEY5_9ACTN|nr:hypothetical protein [Phytohabitans houttuyneae]GFJ81021.1 hypothetical protein Phou_052010 [Phytohabitans houttuyneae]